MCSRPKPPPQAPVVNTTPAPSAMAAALGSPYASDSRRSLGASALRVASRLTIRNRTPSL